MEEDVGNLTPAGVTASVAPLWFAVNSTDLTLYAYN